MRRLLSHCLLVLMGAGLPLLALEFALRALYPETRVLDRHARLGTALRPRLDARKTFGGHERVVRITTNSLGLRDRELPAVRPPGVRRILALGDSFTFGDAVEWVEAWPQQLERALNGSGQAEWYEVVNAGVSGYGTAQQLLLYRALEVQIRPDVVVLGFSVVNDVLDNLCVEEGHYGPRANTPCFGLAGAELELRQPVPGNGTASPRASWLTRWRVVGFVRVQARRLGPSNPALLRLLARAGVQLPLPYLPGTVASWTDPRFSEPGWELTRRILLELRDTLAARRIPLVILVIPSAVQVDAGRRGVLALLGRGHPAVEAYLRDPLKPQRALLGFCEEARLTCVDPLAALYEAEARGERPYYLIDGHWTPAGHRIAAASLVHPLRDLRVPVPSRATALGARPGPSAGVPAARPSPAGLAARGGR
ncbi:MAG: hypothetical protein HY613_09575 [Candidatus Rokubacteria bacterium]|nr:hypothetical protein [Candidatus Rokubacteria bacterium]